MSSYFSIMNENQSILKALGIYNTMETVSNVTTSTMPAYQAEIEKHQKLIITFAQNVAAFVLSNEIEIHPMAPSHVRIDAYGLEFFINISLFSEQTNASMPGNYTPDSPLYELYDASGRQLDTNEMYEPMILDIIVQIHGKELRSELFDLSASGNFY